MHGGMVLCLFGIYRFIEGITFTSELVESIS